MLSDKHIEAPAMETTGSTTASIVDQQVISSTIDSRFFTSGFLDTFLSLSLCLRQSSLVGKDRVA